MLRHCGLFEGIGGFTKAAEQVGEIHTTQFVELNPDAQLLLRSRFPHIPIHPDIRDYKSAPGEFDLITCGFPCTGTSSAGKRNGLEHPDSALWKHGLRICATVRPRFFVTEQPTGVIRRGLRAILGGFRMVGYSSELAIIRASEFGASHERPRLFIISYPDQWRCRRHCVAARSLNSRPAGQTKCEKWFKDNGLIPPGSQLSAPAMALMMGFPEDWFDCLSPPITQAGSEPDISPEGLLPQHKQRSPLDESSTLTQSPPSKIPPTKTRRSKGAGTGYIYRRTITRRGKKYQESYYRYRDEVGKLRSKYIPQRLLNQVEQAESSKKPIADILALLGGDEISRGGTVQIKFDK